MGTFGPFKPGANNHTSLFSFLVNSNSHPFQFNFSFGLYNSDLDTSKATIYVRGLSVCACVLTASPVQFSQFGFPNLVYGAEYSYETLASNRSLRMDLSGLWSAEEETRVYVRVDQEPKSKDSVYTWWSNSPCAGPCKCNATQALCLCNPDDALLDPATCTIIYSTWQWSVAFACLGVIVAVVLVAALVRCCRGNRNKFLEV